MSGINVIPYPNDENSVIINLKLLSYIVDKSSLESLKIKTYKWFVDNNNHLCFKDTTRNKMLIELLTDTNADFVTYSFLNDNKYDYRLSNIRAISNEILSIQQNYVDSNEYSIIDLVYNKSSKRYKKDTHIKNVIWKVRKNKDGNEALIMFTNAKIVEMSVESLDILIKCFELYDTIWFYSPLNGFIMSKSNIGGLYLHLILLGNTSIKHHLVLHKNDNKLDNTLSNLKIVANNFELNNCLISYIAQDNIIVNNIEHPIVNNIKKTNIVIDEPAFMTHPKYGSFYYNKWYPLKYINNLKIEIIEYYEILVKNNDSEYCYIRKFLSNDNYFNYSIPKSKISQAINYNGKIMRIHILKAMLYSIFDTIEPNESIDHIDNNYKNNNITNLQWLSISDNSKKGQETTVLKTNLNGGRNGKYILIKKKNELHIKDYTKSIIIGTFRSIEYATRFIKETLNKDISNKSLASKITRAIKNPHYSVYGFHFETFINDIDSEIWKELPKNISRDDKTYNVSSFGRVRNSFGDYMFPSQNRYNIKYPYVVINYNKYPIHYLVWTAFFGEVPDNMIILHNDLAPLNENGSYRNYLEDLRIGSYSQNSQEYCLYKHFQQIIPNEMPFQQFIEKTPEISELGIKPEPTTNIGKLMAKPPKYIQYIKASDKRGSKFVIGRQCPGLTTDISSSGSKLLSDEDKFLQIIEKYDQITGSNYLKEITI